MITIKCTLSVCFIQLNNYIFIVQENHNLLGMSNPNSSEWQAYTDYVDRMILVGLSGAVRCSLQYFIHNTDPAQCIAPLYEVQLVLTNNQMTFEPSLDLSHKGNFYDIMDNMVSDITKMAFFISRVAKHKQQENYQVVQITCCLHRHRICL